ncbi:MAG: tyrosine--tRNA ligase [Rickettsiales bacterium]|jgi:tyrosyl-tRNA synthetase|nr:tyrosine--tRNA ligase [Rickettsiales bacterium]
MDFIEEFIARGFYHQSTDLEGLKKLTSSKKISAYIGFDPTATSLHVGNLMQIMMLKLLQKHGHRPIVIVGGGTAKIGDPSGKDEMRKMLNAEGLEKNIAGIKASLAKYINFGKNEAIMLNNDEWLKKLNYLDYLRDYGKFFSINRMLKFDSVKLRLEREQNLSFLEFNYMLLQAYDFVELNRRYDCRLQLGGSDQWGNIVNGVELNRRLEEKEVFGLTSPLITTASGTKMGKSANGAVWLSEELLSPYNYYQFWRNSDDRDVIKFLKLFTELPLEQIEEYSKAKGSELNEIKKILAFETTKLCHGEKEAKKAEATAIKMFEEKTLSNNLPTIELSKEKIKKGIPAYLLFQQAGLTSSGGEARRLIRGKGARVNDKVIDEEAINIDVSYCNKDGVIKLSAGKKRHALVSML